MRESVFNKLKPGDTIQNRGTGLAFVIMETLPDYRERKQFIAVRTVRVTNPEEWSKVPPKK